MGRGGERVGLSPVAPSPDLIGRVPRKGGWTPRHMLHLHHLEPWISLLHSPLVFLISLLLAAKLDEIYKKNLLSECGIGMQADILGDWNEGKVIRGGIVGE
jgi:hypothetical protein